MEAVIKVPIDYQGSLVFLRLVEWFQTTAAAKAGSLEAGRDWSPVLANHVYTSLWRALALLGQEGREPGRVTPADRPLIVQVCATATGDAPSLFTALTEGIKFFVRDGADLVCLRFAQSNTHLREGARSMNQRGGDLRAYTQRCVRTESESFQQSLLIAPDKLVDADGQALDASLVRRLKLLVLRVDNALFQPTRPPYLYSEELIQAALVVLAKLTDGEIAAVARQVALHRAHPALNNMSTEKLLPDFGNLLANLAAA